MLLNVKSKATGVFRTIFFIPVLTSWVAAAMLWRWLLSPYYGPINAILQVFGIPGPSWLYDSVWAMPAIVLASLWKDVGFFGLIFLSGLQSIDPAYYEAAEIEWCVEVPEISENHLTITLANNIFRFDHHIDKFVPTLPASHDHDTRWSIWFNRSIHGEDILLRFQILRNGICIGIFLDTICLYLHLHHSPVDDAKEVGIL